MHNALIRGLHLVVAASLLATAMLITVLVVKKHRFDNCSMLFLTVLLTVNAVHRLIVGFNSESVVLFLVVVLINVVTGLLTVVEFLKLVCTASHKGDSGIKSNTDLFKCLTDHVLIVNRTTYKVLYSNDSLVLINTDFFSLVHAIDVCVIEHMLHNTTEVTCRIRLLDEHYTMYSCTSKEGVYNDFDVHYISLRDAQHRIDCSNALFVKQMQMSAIKNNSTLVTGLSHELITPLSIFEMSVSNNDLSSTKSPLLFLNYLIKRTIDSCRVLNGEILHPQMTFHAIDRIVAHVKESLIFFPTSVQLDVTNAVDSTIGVILCDFEWICSILISLIVNALENTTFGTVDLIITNDEQHICFEIVDSGSGIDENLIEYLFQPFSKLCTKSSHGIGLGLYNVSWRARLMFGFYGIKANAGGGCVFWVNLPLKTQDLQPVIDTVKSSNFDIKILVADDTITFRRLLVMKLKKLGYTNISQSENGGQALALLKAERFDLALIDFHMPILNGDEVIDEYLKDADADTTMMLLISADCLSVDLQQKFHCLKKPINFIILQNLISNI